MNLRARSRTRFRKKLLDWFAAQRRDLPWRRTKDPYRVWLSETMLQQTRVAAVIPYYERFLERFPDVRSLAEAPEEEVLRLWSGLGYYSRARNLQRAAREIVLRHGGEFPRRLDDALDLPGIGRYTSAAILSIAYGEPLAVLDGNVGRVLARLEAVRGDLRKPHRWNQLQTSADTLLDRRAPGDWNQAMMELGATVCTPRAPMCFVCPAAAACEARKLGLAEVIPEKRRKQPPVRVHLAAAVFLDAKHRTLLLPPREGPGTGLSALFSRMWQFPAIAVSQAANEELRGYLAEQFGATAMRAVKLDPLANVRQTVTYRNITVKAFRVCVRRLPRSDGARQIALEDFANMPVSNLTRKIARAAGAMQPAR